MIFPAITNAAARVLPAFKILFALLILNFACSCANSPAEGPSQSRISSGVGASRVRVPGSGIAPTMTLSVSPSQINQGNTASFTVTTSKLNSTSATTVSYAMSGTAVLGKHYTLSGTSGKVVIPAGAGSANVTVNALQTSLVSGTKTATMTLRSGTGYNISSGSNKGTLTIAYASASPTPTPTPTASPTPTPTPTATPTPTPTPSPSATPTPTPNPTPSPVPSATPTPTSSPTPSATPRPTPAQQVWISIRTDGLAGSGTQADPYDGSTPDKFDALMNNLQWTPNLGIHLVGAGPFKTYFNHTWFVRAGFVISGDGMDVTTVQMVGNVAGVHYAVVVFRSDASQAVDNITIKDLTVDCNWAELSQTADTGLGGEKNIKASAITLCGSNNLIDHVRCKNSYGSWANKQESFAIFLVGPRSGDGTNNIIQYCRSESPQGNYGNPFALAGWMSSTPNHLITSSKVLSCTAVGVNNGLATGFTSGGVNLANVQDCWIQDSSFTDCYGAAYIDTGSVDGLHIKNNTVTRGWQGVGLSSWVLPKQNIEISGNNFLIQNRVVGGAGYGIYIGYGATNNITIDSNTISFDTTGGGLSSFWGIASNLVTTATYSNNTIGYAYYPVYNSANGTGFTMFNNRTSDGILISNLNNQ